MAKDKGGGKLWLMEQAQGGLRFTSATIVRETNHFLFVNPDDRSGQWLLAGIVWDRGGAHVRIMKRRAQYVHHTQHAAAVAYAEFCARRERELVEEILRASNVIQDFRKRREEAERIAERIGHKNVSGWLELMKKDTEEVKS